MSPLPPVRLDCIAYCFECKTSTYYHHQAVDACPHCGETLGVSDVNERNPVDVAAVRRGCPCQDCTEIATLEGWYGSEKGGA